MSTFAQCGTEVTIYSLARILQPEHVVLGSNIVVDDFVFIGAHRNLTIGNYVHIASHASITGGGECIIADFANVSSGARLFSGSDDFTGNGLLGPTVPSDLRVVSRGFLRLESHVIVGANATILPNVTLGEGAVVGAGAVVTGDLDPWTVYVGAPARPVRARARDGLLSSEAEIYRRHGRPASSFRRPTLTDTLITGDDTAGIWV